MDSNAETKRVLAQRFGSAQGCPVVMNRIESKPEVCNGRPVVIGTRITVHTVLSYLRAGDSIEDVLAAHPHLTREDVLACLDYALRVSELHTTVELVA
ncbi:MAG: hypothetical protein RIQ79_2171 [Verrucomicrobiota bacterium]|jgi:uncharacterized protein (DUF433 family)